LLRRVLRPISQAASVAYHLPGFVSHGRRRARAMSLIDAASPIRDVVFICHGNRCRSPFAMLLFEREARTRNSDARASSAGFVVPGQSSPTQALATAKEHGIDLTDHRSRLINIRELEAADLVVVMDSRQRQAIQNLLDPKPVEPLVLGDLDPLNTGRRTIADPWGRETEVFVDSYERIARCVQELVRRIAAAPTGSTAERR
jgi:protein-tyrosine phosphatase